MEDPANLVQVAAKRSGYLIAAGVVAAITIYFAWPYIAQVTDVKSQLIDLTNREAANEKSSATLWSEYSDTKAKLASLEAEIKSSPTDARRDAELGELGRRTKRLEDILDHFEEEMARTILREQNK